MQSRDRTTMTQALLRRFDAQIRYGIAAEPGLRIERTSRVVRVIGAWNCILYSEFDEATATAGIATELEHFRALDESFQWKVYSHDKPRTLAQHLEDAGFALVECETLMLIELDRVTPDQPAPAGIVVRRLTDAADLNDVAAVAEASFGDDHATLMAEFKARLSRETLAFYVAYDRDVPVAAARLELPPHAEFAGLYGGGTLPSHRGRGIYRSLVAARAREARARGYRYLNVEAAATSRPILQRLGFVPVASILTWRWSPS